MYVGERERESRRHYVNVCRRRILAAVGERRPRCARARPTSRRGRVQRSEDVVDPEDLRADPRFDLPPQDKYRRTRAAVEGH